MSIQPGVISEAEQEREQTHNLFYFLGSLSLEPLRDEEGEITSPFQRKDGILKFMIDFGVSEQEITWSDIQEKFGALIEEDDLPEDGRKVAHICVIGCDMEYKDTAGYVFGKGSLTEKAKEAYLYQLIYSSDITEQRRYESEVIEESMFFMTNNCQNPLCVEVELDFREQNGSPILTRGRLALSVDEDDSFLKED